MKGRIDVKTTQRLEVHDEPDNKFESFGRIVICVLMLLVMGILTMSSILHTTGMEIVAEGQGYDTVINRLREGLETVAYYNDNPITNIILLGVSVAVCFFVMPLLKKIPLWAEIAFIAAWTIVLGVIWVNSSMLAPSEDSFMVSDAAWRFSMDDYDYLANNNYFKYVPYQLGYVFFNEILIRGYSLFAEVENFIFLQYVSVIMLAGAYIAVILINKRLFKDERVRHMTVFLLAFAAQPLILTSFLYGIFPGLCIALWAVYFEIVYFQTDKLRYGIISAVLIAMASILKPNYMIALIAMMAIAFVKLFKCKKFVKDLVFMAAAVALTLSGSPAVKSMYESRSGVDLGDSIPYVSWISMGLSEAGNAPGWYNYVPALTNFEVNNFNAADASEDSIENILTRIEYFNDNPQYAKDFFYRKFVSQWNETSYQSIWNNKVRYQYEEKGSLAAWVCGDGEDTMKDYMDVYSLLIFTAALAGIVGCLRSRRFLTATLPLMILGGVLYHLLAEAKSQYAIPYFIMMIGVAGYGIVLMYDFAAKKLQESGRSCKFFLQPEPVAVPAAEVAVTEDIPSAEETAPEKPASEEIPAEEKTEAES